MPDIAAIIRWDSYTGAGNEPGLFQRTPLAFNSRQERLHTAGPGDSLWLVSRAPDNQQYYFVARLAIDARETNPPDSELAEQFGPYRLRAAAAQSIDLARRLPAEGLLRAFQFDPALPVKHGASIGQSLQAIRILTDLDAAALQSALDRALSPDRPRDT